MPKSLMIHLLRYAHMGLTVDPDLKPNETEFRNGDHLCKKKGFAVTKERVFAQTYTLKD